MKRIAAVLMLMLGMMVLTPAVNASAGNQIPTFKVCSDINYGGTCTTIYRSAKGTPDSWPGYFIELPRGIKSTISSVTGSPTGGNYVYIYEQTWAGTWGNICYSGYLPVSYVGSGCNDDSNNIRLMTR